MAKSKRNTHRTVVQPEQVEQGAEPMQEPIVDAEDSFESPESSTIDSAAYDRQSLVMVVYFKRGPLRDLERYDYGGIPHELWLRFLTAESKGHFFSTQIRPLYAGKPEKQ